MDTIIFFIPNFLKFCIKCQKYPFTLHLKVLLYKLSFAE